MLELIAKLIMLWLTFKKSIFISLFIVGLGAVLVIKLKWYQKTKHLIGAISAVLVVLIGFWCFDSSALGWNNPLWETDWVIPESEQQFAYFDVTTVDFIAVPKGNWDSERISKEQSNTRKAFNTVIFGKEYSRSLETVCWEATNFKIEFRLGCRYIDDAVSSTWNYKLKNSGSTLVLSKGDSRIELEKMELTSWVS